MDSPTETQIYIIHMHMSIHTNTVQTDLISKQNILEENMNNTFMEITFRTPVRPTIHKEIDKNVDYN